MNSSYSSRWISRISRHPLLEGTMVPVAVMVGTQISPKTRMVNLSKRAIADRISVTEKTVQTVADELVKLAYLVPTSAVDLAGRPVYYATLPNAAKDSL